MNRLICVRYLPTTNTKGSRLKVTMAGFKAKTYGFHTVGNGSERPELAAAREYYLSLWAEAGACRFSTLANPSENSRDTYVLVQA